YAFCNSPVFVWVLSVLPSIGHNSDPNSADHLERSMLPVGLISFDLYFGILVGLLIASDFVFDFIRSGTAIFQ
ncbi:hypothetical protein, partial [Bacillus sp. GbtcB15]|uniref:hypothetical protein n=1 Tax=Bacillus sp. GbtcB15 TaxID=2824760 RepID=UPI001C2F8ECD